MINVFQVKNNEILIESPGKSSVNKIKNDLIWDINQLLLSLGYSLYVFSINRMPINSLICFPFTKKPQKYLVINQLDESFINRSKINKNELNNYRRIMDPFYKMSDDVFFELCCIENTDVEYFAINGELDSFLQQIESKKTKMIDKRIRLSAQIFISLFGFKEMQITINNNDLMGPIVNIVSSHCVWTNHEN